MVINEETAREKYAVGTGRYEIEEYLYIVFDEDHGWVLYDYRDHECGHEFHAWAPNLPTFNEVRMAVREFQQLRKGVESN